MPKIKSLAEKIADDGLRTGLHELERTSRNKIDDFHDSLAIEGLKPIRKYDISDSDMQLMYGAFGFHPTEAALWAADSYLTKKGLTPYPIARNENEQTHNFNLQRGIVSLLFLRSTPGWNEGQQLPLLGLKELISRATQVSPLLDRLALDYGPLKARQDLIQKFLNADSPKQFYLSAKMENSSPSSLALAYYRALASKQA